jgi:hypothetical protein
LCFITISGAGRLFTYEEESACDRDDEFANLDTGVKESEWFHVTDCKMKYTEQEYADMQLFVGERRGNSAETEQLCADRFPKRRSPSRYFLNTSLELVHFSLFAYFLAKQINSFLHPSFSVIPFS